MGKIDGKIAIVTGAASGMGKATAILFAKEGAKVVVADIQDELGKETVKIITEGGGNAVFVHTDVRKVDDVKNMIKTTVDTYGKLDILFNNAGVFGAMSPIILWPDEIMDNVVATHIKGVWNGMKYGSQQMFKTGGGTIINSASVTGYLACPMMAAYAASKAGVISLTKSAAVEMAKRKVRVNCIAPGAIETPMLMNSVGQAGLPDVVKSIPMGRVGKPEEIAQAVLFFASDDSSYVTGQVLAVDGGMAPN
jgi:NAD(P)-dependent dehydrogenase (short-subunit alcohol dehydrogenase family)